MSRADEHVPVSLIEDLRRPLMSAHDSAGEPVSASSSAALLWQPRNVSRSHSVDSLPLVDLPARRSSRGNLALNRWRSSGGADDKYARLRTCGPIVLAVLFILSIIVTLLVFVVSDDSSAWSVPWVESLFEQEQEPSLEDFLDGEPDFVHGNILLPAHAENVIDPAPLSVGSPSDIPEDFDLSAYLKWNPELELEGLTTLSQAHEHYLRKGRYANYIYKDYNVTIRYTACGGCMNQQYSHVAALVLAHLSHAKRVIWPAMQERESYGKRYHPHAERNMQTWKYLDATRLYDMESIQRRVKDELGIEVIKHPPSPPLPDMTKPETAFQTHSMDFMPHDQSMRYNKHIYIARHSPQALARAVMDAGRQAYIATGRHPTTLLVDLPCTLFMIETRTLSVVEDIAKLITFSPTVQQMADKVIEGLKAETESGNFNGIHLRMEKDAMDWAAIIGETQYWEMYKTAMSDAGFARFPYPLYVASGLLKSSDDWSKAELSRLSREIIENKYTQQIVYKERYLSEVELDSICNEQSGLIDFLVMVQSSKLVAIGVSTFSFYLAELRLMEQRPPEDNTLVMPSRIGTDELFFSCGVVAIRTRAAWEAARRLPDICRKQNGERCFTPDPPPGAA